jgi:hypothetical protein
MDSKSSDFERAAEGHSGTGIVGELWLFLRHNRKWWLLPILLVIAMFGVLSLLSTTGAAPFIYTLF